MKKALLLKLWVLCRFREQTASTTMQKTPSMAAYGPSVARGAWLQPYASGLSALLLLCLPGLAMASGGAWHATATGPGLQNRGMQAFSQALNPPEPVAGTMTEISWRYVLTGPAPSDLRVHLCAESRCVVLDGPSGTTRGLTNVQAGETLHFIYGVVGKGRLNQTMRVLSNEVMVNYR